MEKLVYLLWDRETRELDQTRKLLLEECAARLLDLGAVKLSMNLRSHPEVPASLPTPKGETPLSAQVSLWLNCLDQRGPFEEMLRATGARLAGYLVTESLYTDYGDNQYAEPRSWPDGERSPGLLMVTLMEKPDRLTDEEWINHWQGVQSPVSARMQPRTRYVRNAVVRPLTAEAPPYQGIVEEGWPSAEDITDPMRFYGGGGSEDKLRENMKAMMDSVMAFLDLDRIRTTIMSEYLLKT